MAASGSRPAYRFDGYVLDTARAVLLGRDGRPIPLRPKSFDLLLCLIESAGTVLARDDLMRAVWPGTYVSDDNVAQCVKDIRRALGDGEQRLLRTVPRRGYMLAASVSAVPAAGDAGPMPAPPHDPETGPALPRPREGRPVLIVLPFEALGDDAGQRCFADGLTEDLVADLTHFQDLHIISPHRRGTPWLSLLPAVDRSNSLRADYAVNGSIRRAGRRLRAGAQLRCCRTDRVLWADQFDRAIDDLFAVQEELATTIARCLDIQIYQETLRRLRAASETSLDAYESCLRGRDLHSRSTEAGNAAARAMFARAIAADPHFASAYAWQAQTVLRGFTLGWGEPRGPAAIAPALALAQRAVELEPFSATALSRFAFVLQVAGRPDEALEIGRAAIHANPCDVAARASVGEVLSKAGNHAAGAEELRLAIALNPFHPPFWRATLGRALLLAGHPEEALVELNRCAAASPDYRPCHSSIVVACVETGRLDAARAALREVQRLRPGWRSSEYDGVFGFQREADTARFLAAFRTAEAQAP